MIFQNIGLPGLKSRSLRSLHIGGFISRTRPFLLINRADDAFGLAYSPTYPADWVAPAPTTVQEALDRLAAAQGGPIP